MTMLTPCKGSLKLDCLLVSTLLRFAFFWCSYKCLVQMQPFSRMYPG